MKHTRSICLVLFVFFVGIAPVRAQDLGEIVEIEISHGEWVEDGFLFACTITNREGFAFGKVRWFDVYTETVYAVGSTFGLALFDINDVLPSGAVMLSDNIGTIVYDAINGQMSKYLFDSDMTVIKAAFFPWKQTVFLVVLDNRGNLTVTDTDSTVVLSTNVISFQVDQDITFVEDMIERRSVFSWNPDKIVVELTVDSNDDTMLDAVRQNNDLALVIDQVEPMIIVSFNQGVQFVLRFMASGDQPAWAHTRDEIAYHGVDGNVYLWGVSSQQVLSADTNWNFPITLQPYDDVNSILWSLADDYVSYITHDGLHFYRREFAEVLLVSPEAACLTDG